MIFTYYFYKFDSSFRYLLIFSPSTWCIVSLNFVYGVYYSIEVIHFL